MENVLLLIYVLISTVQQVMFVKEVNAFKLTNVGMFTVQLTLNVLMDNVLLLIHVLMFNVFQDILAIMDIVFQLTHVLMLTVNGDSGVNLVNVLLNHNATAMMIALEEKFVNSEDVLINVL